jgi:PEP-CTERM motif
MRMLRFLIAWALAFAALPASAQNYDSYFFAGPESGTWKSYRAEFSAPTDYLFLSINIDYTQCFNGFSDEPYICLDSPVITEGCDAFTSCAAPYLRRVTFDATGVDFAYYVPRSFFFCQDYPPAGRQNIHCADFYYSASGYLDYEYSGAAPVVTLTVTGGGTVPEPASWALMIFGFGMVGASLRRQRTAVRFVA